MTIQDFLFQALTTLAGAFAGVVTSLYFFREQQKTDFQNLLSKIGLLETLNTQQGTGNISSRKADFGRADNQRGQWDTTRYLNGRRANQSRDRRIKNYRP